MANNGFPNINVPAVDGNGCLTPQWIRFFQTLTQQPGPIAKVTPSSSPFTYTASGNGQLLISGGTITGLSLTRGKVSALLATSTQLIALSQGDQVTISYSAAPSVTFIPG